MEEFHHPALLAGNGIPLLHALAEGNVKLRLEHLILLFSKSLVLLLDSFHKSPLCRMTTGLDGLVTDPANLTLRMSLLCRRFLN